MWLVWATGEVRMRLWWGNLKEIVYFEELDVDRRIL